jgi:hypothetical protein
VLSSVRLSQVAGLGVGFIGGGYVFGSWFAKFAAFVLGRDVSRWGDTGGIWGGLLGLAVFAFVLSGKVNS